MIPKDAFMKTIKQNIDNFVREELDMYAAFNYNTVQNIVKDIQNDKTDNKPILHFTVTDKSEGPRLPIPDEDGNDSEGRKIYFEFAVYSAVTNSYESHKTRDFVLDEVEDELKHTFDSKGDSLPFRNVHFRSRTSPMMGENPDGLYTVEHTLEFWVTKEL